MSGAFTPVSILYPAFNINVNLLDNDILRHNFFRRAAEYLFRGLTFRKVLPEVGLFIDKDGGRMIMLYLYLQAIKNKNSTRCHNSVFSQHAGKRIFRLAYSRQPHYQIGAGGRLS